jgi:hypothetical protein
MEKRNSHHRHIQGGHKNAQTNIRKYKRTRHPVSTAFSAAMNITAATLIFPAQKGDLMASLRWLKPKVRGLFLSRPGALSQRFTLISEAPRTSEGGTLQSSEGAQEGRFDPVIVY